MNVPALRFPEFEGEWTHSRLGDFSSFSKGKGISKNQTHSELGFLCVIYGELYTTYETRADKIWSRTLVGHRDLVISRGGEIMVPASGETSLDIATATVMPHCGVALGGDINIIETTDYPDFIAESLRGVGKKSIVRLAQGNSVVHVYGKHLSSIIVARPSLPEQKKIAAFLGVVDAKIAALRERRAGLERYKRGLMQALFNQTLRFTKPDGSAFPNWEEKRLGEVASVNPKSSTLPDFFWYIDLESVNNGVLGTVEEIEKVEAPSRAQRLLKKGDVLFQTVRPYQRNNLFFDLDGVFVASTGYAQIRAKKNQGFLFQLLHTDVFVNRVLERCTGTSYPAINSNDLAKISMPIPHPDEQAKIANALSAMDAKIAAVGDQIARMEAFKKGLLQQMFV